MHTNLLVEHKQICILMNGFDHLFPTKDLNLDWTIETEGHRVSLMTLKVDQQFDFVIFNAKNTTLHKYIRCKMAELRLEPFQEFLKILSQSQVKIHLTSFCETLVSNSLTLEIKHAMHSSVIHSKDTLILSLHKEWE